MLDYTLQGMILETLELCIGRETQQCIVLPLHCGLELCSVDFNSKSGLAFKLKLKGPLLETSKNTVPSNKGTEHPLASGPLVISELITSFTSLCNTAHLPRPLQG